MLFICDRPFRFGIGIALRLKSAIDGFLDQRVE